MACLSDTAADIAADSGSHVRFARFRGDGWQMLLPEAGTALRAALRVIAALTAADQGFATRIGVGLGAADLPADGALSAGRGQAFLDAGDTLDRLTEPDRLSFGQAGGPALPVIVALIDWQARNWTAPQAEALFEALRHNPPTQAEIAARFGISRQAVGLRLGGTALSALRDAIGYFEDNVRTLHETAR